METGANVLFVEEMERGETDVGHFLFAKKEALIGRGIIRLRDTSSGHRGCGCTTHQRKTQSGGTQHLHGGGFGCAFLLRSLLDPWHGRIPPEVLFEKTLGKRALGQTGAQELTCAMRPSWTASMLAASSTSLRAAASGLAKGRSVVSFIAGIRTCSPCLMRNLPGDVMPVGEMFTDPRAPHSEQTMRKPTRDHG
ncbi:hypothetical protein AXW67_21230 [Bradyrhizobium neotropicale]|uniref:Uncharacterized protein n=1 Tax=Bradyrhizobium neotropicale TaxID=1497615 RepID=A0A176YYX9_9BRAD|nr:hypothetical protein AXW67_21230 [Bradyrhizobium neotropicale]